MANSYLGKEDEGERGRKGKVTEPGGGQQERMGRLAATFERIIIVISSDGLDSGGPSIASGEEMRITEG